MEWKISFAAFTMGSNLHLPTPNLSLQFGRGKHRLKERHRLSQVGIFLLERDCSPTDKLQRSCEKNTRSMIYCDRFQHVSRLDLH